jgi:hypothetical protein
MPSTECSTLPVEFLEILDDRYDDLALTAHLANRGLAVLPGRHFFWSAAAKSKPVNRFIRVALLKEMGAVKSGARLLRQGLLSLGGDDWGEFANLPSGNGPQLPRNERQRCLVRS